jgi:2-polyprenyl-3-methyl-5-hydroxy-6-metoxy-1,4-benzoquinol methylase
MDESKKLEYSKYNINNRRVDIKETFRDLRQYIDKKHNCFVCGGNNFVSWAKEEYLEALFCKDCEMISVNPHFTEDGLDNFYSNYYKNRVASNKLAEQRKQMYIQDRNWILNYISEGNVLDIGCSGGDFLSTFSSDSWNKFGIDLTDDALKLAEKNHSIKTFKGKIWETDVGQDYDLVMMRGVIEHFKNPIPAMKKAVDILKPGGLIYITATPAGDAFAFNVYRNKWRLFTPLEHIHFFSAKHLNKLFKDFGAESLATHYPYQETPYANVFEDHERIIKDIVRINNFDSDNALDYSQAFPGSMITGVWKKN